MEVDEHLKQIHHWVPVPIVLISESDLLSINKNLTILGLILACIYWLLNTIAHSVHARAEVDATYRHSKDRTIHQEEGLTHFNNRSLTEFQIVLSLDIHISLSYHIFTKRNATVWGKFLCPGSPIVQKKITEIVYICTQQTGRRVPRRTEYILFVISF